MQRIIKNTLLNYLPDNFKVEGGVHNTPGTNTAATANIINPARIFEINNKPVRDGYIVYLCERELRAKDNFALLFALQKSKELNLPMKVIHPKIHYEYKPKQKFIDRQIKQTKAMFDNLNLDFEIIGKTPAKLIKKIKPACLIIDFNPILNRNYLKNIGCKVFETDGHNIIPARYVSDKQEYSAATLRRKIYFDIHRFLTEFDNITHEKVEADYILEDFIKNKLSYYSELKNNPTADILSGLSKYLNLGFISSQRIAIEVIKSDNSDADKESFLEELIVRKELSDNFCLNAGRNYKNFSDIPCWAKKSLINHHSDIRPYIYTVNEFEKAKTHDKLWNAAQIQLINEGVIHGYLRMYWAKKIPEWTISLNEAIKIAIYLNDKYAYDAPSPNGYTGILWALGGLHDRAFADYPVTGKIRRMSYDSIKRKYDLTEYIAKHTYIKNNR